MKLWRRRKPVDLVSSQVEELEARNAELIKEEARDPFTEALFREGGIVRADGGWCAPSEAIYNLPEISVRRGGIRHDNRPVS
jgi:hypothetical protein